MAEHGYDDLARDLAALGRAVDVPASGRRPCRRRPGAAAPTAPGLRRRSRRARRRRHRRRAVAPWSARCCSRCWPRRRCGPPSPTGSASAASGSSGARPRRRRPTPPPPTVVARRFARRTPPRHGRLHRVALPAALGAPDGVEVSADRRLLSMSWTGRRRRRRAAGRVRRAAGLHLRQDAHPASSSSPWPATSRCGSTSRTRSSSSSPTAPSHRETARLAGNTLIWMHGGTTLRLEGDLEPSSGPWRSPRRPCRRRLTGTGPGDAAVYTSGPVPRRPPCAAIRAALTASTAWLLMLADARPARPTRAARPACCWSVPGEGRPPRCTTATTTTSSSRDRSARSTTARPARSTARAQPRGRHRSHGDLADPRRDAVAGRPGLPAGDGGPWIATQVMLGNGSIWDAPVVWHQPADGKELTLLLDSLGVGQTGQARRVPTSRRQRSSRAPPCRPR